MKIGEKGIRSGREKKCLFRNGKNKLKITFFCKYNQKEKKNQKNIVILNLKHLEN